MNKRVEREIAEIGAIQKKLRDSIEQPKELAEQAETLLKKHKKTLKDQASD